MRIRHFLVLFLVLGAVSACRSAPASSADQTQAWVGRYVTATKAVSEGQGTVGYVKTFEYTREGGGEPYRLFHVYDLKWRERGVVSPGGTATKFVDLPPEIARARGVVREQETLPAMPLEWNVALILDLKPGLKLVPITPEEIAGK